MASSGEFMITAKVKKMQYVVFSFMYLLHSHRILPSHIIMDALPFIFQPEELVKILPSLRNKFSSFMTSLTFPFLPLTRFQ